MSRQLDPGGRWHRDAWLDAAWDSEALKPNERLLAYVFARYAGKQKITWCPWDELRRRTGIKSRDSISKAIRGLVDAGWLKETEKRRQHYSPRYEMIIPTGQGSGAPVGKPSQTSGIQTSELREDSLQTSGKQTSGDSQTSGFSSQTSGIQYPRRPESGLDLSNRRYDHIDQTEGARCPPEPPLREDVPSVRLDDQSDLPPEVVTDQPSLGTQPTTRAPAENIVHIFSRTQILIPCPKCGVYLEPDGSCFNRRNHSAAPLPLVAEVEPPAPASAEASSGKETA